MARCTMSSTSEGTSFMRNLGRGASMCMRSSSWSSLLLKGSFPASISYSNTPIEYISPEAAQGMPTTPVSHLYSMGVLLYEMIAGKLPFNSKDDHELLRMHIDAPRPRLRMKDVPSEVDDIVQRAMDRKPSGRYRS